MPEQSRADAYAGAAVFDGGFKICGHAHRQGIEAWVCLLHAQEEFAQLGKLVCFIAGFRQSHQTAQNQAGQAGYAGCQCVQRGSVQSVLALFGGCLDLQADIERGQMGGALFGQTLRNFLPVNGVYPVKMLCHRFGFVALKGADKVPFQMFQPGGAQGDDLVHTFLHVVFTEGFLPATRQRGHVGRRECLADCQQHDFCAFATVLFTSRSDALSDLRQSVAKIGGEGVLIHDGGRIWTAEVYQGRSDFRVQCPHAGDAGNIAPRMGCVRVSALLLDGSIMTTFHDFSTKTLQGKDLPFSSLAGKVVLVVNTASKCGFTPQYKGLQALYDKYRDQGLEIVGFPCNQFGAQEPGNADDINQFCEINYGVNFPLSEKVDVNGANAHPVYKFLTKEAKGVLGTEAIKWNFTKFLVGKDGKVLKRYAPTTSPADLAEDIEGLLKA